MLIWLNFKAILSRVYVDVNLLLILNKIGVNMKRVTYDNVRVHVCQVVILRAELLVFTDIAAEAFSKELIFSTSTRVMHLEFHCLWIILTWVNREILGDLI